ncbi:MAG: KpsF/GutQ family sugar-phosphate isomerase [Armatimonadetes bacterium CG_4_10_14_3_um_filter_66_18]|nr:KpsF/GutQ family sugar-phosphate isomerase [Armatimonadota bacterium]OIP05168.1 MAG: hypothetical protein AUJ96_11310 [Armatimonadetes bacterium CG2_30_66_41]PIU95717.1 MAG: KpsF/GutQ family sugar-phosphate isomerase [Armatimonadetes bacterium CG06_land_8_20_14_3_00_66_21]PIX41361.1 MAG: KpsF/GutQ family sugar-phosphate isomerase [Armatimonadetes bacterium CG_4_8_14_3_um_filter_66_20]PIY50192.1 MAG: KpsF/GutQ family sugar-phosphate isomerase [Armatimonadetes bacterium CG_4_10_14_3_um_filter_
MSKALEAARNVLRIESDAVASLVERLGDEFEQAVRLVLDCKGRVVVTGIGKSGAIGRKLASTFASTGTPALFLHSGEGLHGDLGMVTTGDVLIAISYSGRTEDLINILPIVRDMGVKVIALTGDKHSLLALSSEVVLEVRVAQEACPLNLAPTASSTATLAMGDALAVAVMGEREFTREHFARFHPGGTLGRGASLTVADFMRTGHRVARVEPYDPARQVLAAITQAQAGAALVVDGSGVLAGIVTDGDMRRHLMKDDSVLSKPVAEVMTSTPTTVHADTPAREAIRIMEEKVIDDLPVIDPAGRPVGMLDVQDLLRAGVL